MHSTSTSSEKLNLRNILKEGDKTMMLDNHSHLFMVRSMCRDYQSIEEIYPYATIYWHIERDNPPIAYKQGLDLTPLIEDCYLNISILNDLEYSYDGDNLIECDQASIEDREEKRAYYREILKCAENDPGQLIESGYLRRLFTWEEAISLESLLLQEYKSTEIVSVKMPLMSFEVSKWPYDPQILEADPDIIDVISLDIDCLQLPYKDKYQIKGVVITANCFWQVGILAFGS